MTLTRLLQALAALELVQQDDDGRYRTGPAVYDLLPVEETRARLLRLGGEPLRELAAQTSQSASLLHFDGETISCIARELQVDSVVLAEVGHQVRGLAYHPAAVCCFDPARWNSILAAHPQEDRPALRRWLKQERKRLEEQGYATGHSGTRGRMAAPIFDSNQRPVAALMLGATRQLLTARQLAAWSSPLLASARRILL